MNKIISLLGSLLLAFTVLFSCKHKVEILPNDEIYTCLNHVHVIDDHPAKCPFDKTELIKTKITDEQRKMLKDRDYERVKE